MTHLELVQTINKPKRARKFTDFFFEDDFYLCVPKGCTMETARRKYKETHGRKAPRIEECHWHISE